MRGLIGKLVHHIGMHRNTVWTIWRKYVTVRKNGNDCLSAVHKEKSQYFGNSKYNIQILKEEFKKIPLCQRLIQKNTAEALGVSQTMACKTIKSGLLRMHSSAIKPTLTEENKMHCFVLAWIVVSTLTKMVSDGQN